MSTNMDGPEALIEEVLELPVEDLQTLLVAVIDRLQPLAKIVASGSEIPRNQIDLDLVQVDPSKKIQIIKEIRNWSYHGLKEAKDLFEMVQGGGGQARILTGADELTAERAVKAFNALNAKINVTYH